MSDLASASEPEPVIYDGALVRRPLPPILPLDEAGSKGLVGGKRSRWVA